MNSRFQIYGLAVCVCVRVHACKFWISVALALDPVVPSTERRTAAAGGESRVSEHERGTRECDQEMRP
jgi:hypothetical protein